jgi:tetratricopeptide (TPR) repeat protein
MKFAFIRFIISALLTLFLVVNFSYFSQHIIAQTSSSPLLQQGLEEYQNDNFPEALRIWQNALQQTENHANQSLIYNYLSLAQQRLGKWEEAQISIDRARELLPENNPDLHARIRNTQGRLYWSLGQPENALKQWREATQLYEKADRIDGAIGAGINQALALQTLGFGLDAEQQLEAINRLVEELSNDSPLKLMGYQRLGQVWRQLGKLEKSRNILTKAKDLPIADGKIWLELGNLERALSDRAIIFGEKTTDIEEYNQDALNSYQKAIELAATDSQRVQAQLNELSFLIELGEWEKAIALQQKLQPFLDRLPLSRSSIKAQLSFNRSLTCLWNQDRTENVPGCSYRHDNLTKKFNSLNGEQIAYNLAKIVEQSQTLTDSLAESSARGLLGEIYERTGQLPEARNLTREALQLAEDRQALDLRYRWEWQLGRLLKKQGQPQSAIAQPIKTPRIGGLGTNRIASGRCSNRYD